MLTATTVAEYFLSKTEDGAGEGITNLKLQKLVYYAQGFSLAIFGHPLFEEDIEAWAHGPVVPELYRNYKIYGSESIPPPSRFDDSCIDVDDASLLDEVYEVFGQYSAWKLRDMTHAEPPWTTTPTSEVIPHAVLKEYFETRLA